MRPTMVLLATTLLGGGAFAFVVADSTSDGCSVTVEAHNLGRDPTRVDWRASRSRTGTVVLGMRVPDPWHHSATGWTGAAPVHVDHWRATKRGDPNSG